MAETTEPEQQIEPEPAPAAPPATSDTTRFDPWVGIGYHVIQVLFVVATLFIAVDLADDIQNVAGFVRQARAQFLFTLGVIGLPAIGMAIALRLGQLDLSVGAMITFGTAIYAANEGRSSALLAVVGTALAIGAVTGAVSGALRVPAWLSTFALSFVLLARFFEVVGPNPAPFGGEPRIDETTPPLAVAFFLVGLGAIVVFFVLDVLRQPAQVMRIEEIGLGFRILLTAGALAISAGLAAYAGAMQAERVRFATAGIESIFPAILAAVLIGGVGVFGARVSLVGTMLGAVGMAVLQFGVQLASDADVATRLYVSALPLAAFLVLRGVAAVLRKERIPA